MNHYFYCIGLIVMLILLPVPVAASGNISVSSSPVGAEISINGTTTGLYTPGIIESVPTGTHTVSLTLSGYETWTSSSVTVTDDATTTLSESLTNLTSTVSFESYPAGAQVYVDNVYVGYTNISGYTLGYGSRTVLMQLSGYDDVTQTVLVNSSTQTVTTPFASAVVNGSIFFTSYPSYSSVYIFSNYSGTTPLTVSDLAPGSYSVLVYRAGYSNWTDTVVVTSGTETDVYAKLTATATVATTAIPEIASTPPPAPAPIQTMAAITTSPVMAAAKSNVKAKTAATLPTPWPTSTATQESPVDPLLIIGAAGIGFLAIRKH
jgi:hypothetical protein